MHAHATTEDQAAVERDDRFRILLVDDCPFLTMEVGKAFRREMPDALLLTARTVAEAQELVAEGPVQFFILDIHLPDGSGLDLLCDLCTTSPGCQTVMITGVPLPHYRQRAAQLNVLHFLEKPIKTQVLLEMAQECRRQFEAAHEALAPAASAATEPEAEQDGEGAFAASLSGLTPLDIIQLKCLTGFCGTLEFTNPRGPTGRLYFSNSEIVHAQVEGLTGLDAVTQIISWRRGRVREVNDGTSPPKTIFLNWQQLLLQSVHAVDEQALTA